MKPNKETLKDELAKLDGSPPHNKPSNPLVNDGYYLRALENKYGMTLEEMREFVADKVL